MRTNIATDNLQSQRLLRCGVSADTADMSWALKRRITDEFTPAWSLSALLRLLPKEIDIDECKYRIGIYFESPDEPIIGNQWCLYYKPKKNTEKSHYIDDVPIYAPDLIECAVLMVEWLTRHNYKLNEQ